MDAEHEQALTWTREVRARLQRHPRAAWREDPSPTARFWLEIHDGFRREADGLLAVLDAHRSPRAAVELAVVSGRRLKELITRLHGHHEVEDFEYFPAFRALEPRLASGLDALATEHVRLQSLVDEALTASANLLAAIENHAPGAARTIDRYAARAGDLCRALARHLHDEEELIIPLLLERR